MSFFLFFFANIDQQTSSYHPELLLFLPWRRSLSFSFPPFHKKNLKSKKQKKTEEEMSFDAFFDNVTSSSNHIYSGREKLIQQPGGGGSGDGGGGGGGFGEGFEGGFERLSESCS